MRFAKRPLLLAMSSLAVLSLVVAAAITLGGGRVHASAGQTLMLTRTGSSSFSWAAPGTDASVQSDEINTFDEADAGDGTDDAGNVGPNRTIVGATTGKGTPINSSKQAKSNPELGTHFDGLNFKQQRFANGGNQFSVEPPDQGLCVGNGFVLESANDVLRVFDTAGNPKTGVVDLNTFYGYAPAIDRAHGNVRGPSITDPICLYDRVMNRFVHVVLTLEVVPSGPFAGQLTGPNHFDIAVSDTSDPTGTWTIYKLPVQNDGTDDTPNHACPGRTVPRPWATNPHACLGDYPHIGADRNGIYITSNEFPVYVGGFHGANIYAISKAALTSGRASLPVTLFDTSDPAIANPDGAGFTVWPAQSPGTQYADDNNGTEYFLSSRAVFTDDGTSNSILLWSLTNTASLSTGTPSLSLSITNIGVNTYSVPPKARQKPTANANLPLLSCLKDPDPTCKHAVGAAAPDLFLANEAESPLDANDSRFGQVFYANGKVWGALGTGVTFGSGATAETRAGIAYYIVNPSAGKLVLQGTAGIEHTDLTYGTVAVLENGRGLLSFTLTGDNDFPSVAYAGLDALIGLGDIHIAAAGLGPQDGFTGYWAFKSTLARPRPRWGDYGAAAVDGSDIWFSAEYIGQTCTYTQYLADMTCGGTRGPLGNWDTHIAKVTP